MDNYKKRMQVMAYLTRKPVTPQDIEIAQERLIQQQPFYQETPQLVQDDIARPQTGSIPLYQNVQPGVAIQETLPTYAPPDITPVMPQAPGLPDQQARQLELATGGRVNFQDAGSATLSINPMLDNINPNTISGAALPAAGITIAAIADKFNVSLEDAGRMLKRLYTGPEGLVIGGERLTEEAKPKIETFPSSEKQTTTLVTKKPDQIETDIGLTPPTIDTKLPGLKPDTGEDTSILFSRKSKLDPEKLKKITETYDELKKEKERIPFVSEVSDKTGIPDYTVKHYLTKLNIPLNAPSSLKRIQYESFKEFGDVDKPSFSQSGIKWPDQETKDFYEKQIVDRFKLAQNSAEFREKKQAGELLTNEQLAEKYNISVPVVKRLNRQIIEDYNLDKKPVKGSEQIYKDRSIKRQEATKIFSDPNFEQKIRGNLGVHLGHMSDLYSRIVKAETQGYAPAEINKALADTIDSVIKNINKAQDKLIKDKPEGWKEKLEEYNIKGMNYAALSKGYKTFEVTDPDTLEKTPINVQYGKIIDPTGIYEGKSIKEIAKETNLTELNKIEKAFSQAAKGDEVKNPELLTEENFKKLKNYKLFEINRKSVLKTQSKIPASERKQISKDIVNYRDFKFNKGGRVKLKNGTDETYNPEIPSLGETDPIGILEQRLMNSKDINEIMKLLEIIKQAKEERAAEEKIKEEYKMTQKAKGIKYKEDFPSEAAYFAETGKQLLTNPKYFLSKGLKGAVEGTEWLVGQPMKTLFSQEGKNWELYHPVAGEKLGINKYIEKNIPKGATTGTLLAGDVAEIAGTFADPFLAYGLAKKAMSPSKTKGIPSMEEIDPTRRDILKTGAIMGTGAALYPTAKKLGLFEELTKATEVTKAGAKLLPKVHGMPEWFPSLVSRIEKEGKFPFSNYATTDNVKIKELSIPSRTGKGPNETYIMTKYPNGKIEIHADIKGGAYDQPFELHYTPPESFIDETTGKVIKEPGDFSIVEQRPRVTGGPHDADWELDWDTVSKENALSDIERVEETVTGKIANPKEAKARAAQRDSYYNSPYDDIVDRYGDIGLHYDDVAKE